MSTVAQAAPAIGIVGYSLDDLTIIDGFGLTDRVIARNDDVPPNRSRTMAHDRRPPPGYLEQRGLNFRTGGRSYRWAEDFLFTGYAIRLDQDVWMPVDSPNHAWLERSFAHVELWQRQLTANGAGDRVTLDGRLHRTRRALGTFDRGLDGWTISGAIDRQPARVPAVGRAAIDTSATAARIAATGAVDSPPFEARADEVVTFLVAGGSTREVSVELRCGGRLVRTTGGRNDDRMELRAWPLAPYAGTACAVRIRDDSREEWGWLRADQFVVMAPVPGE